MKSNPASLLLATAIVLGSQPAAFADGPPPSESQDHVTLPSRPLSGPAGDVQTLLRQAEADGGVGIGPVQRQIHLPGLKPDSPTLRPFVLHTRNGVNEVVTLSSSLLNRIATPFAKPVVIDTRDAENQILGSDVYYRPLGNNPVGLYIVDSNNPSQAISLTVMPSSSIPGQNVLVKLEDLRTVNKNLAGGDGIEGALSAPADGSYTSSVLQMMRAAITGAIPGFNPIPLEGGTARVGDLEVKPEVVFAGGAYDVYRYELRALGSEPMDLVETAFYRDGVKAVAFFPRGTLKPQETSYVFLLADKPASAGATRD